MQRAMRAVIHTACSVVSDPAYAAMGFSPKLGPVQTSAAMPSSVSAHCAMARQFTRKATCAYSL